MGLLLLRSAAGFAAIFQSVTCLIAVPATTWQSLAFVFLGLAGVLLIVGLLTPLVCMVAVVSYLSLGSASCHLTTSALVQTIAAAAAIALLGPGAASLDARLFGRREIIIPDTNSSRLPK